MWLLWGLVPLWIVISMRVGRLETAVGELTGQVGDVSLKLGGYSAQVNRMKLEMAGLKGNVPAREEPEAGAGKPSAVVKTDSEKPVSRPKPSSPPQSAAPPGEVAGKANSGQMKSAPSKPSKPENPPTVFTMSVSEAVMRLASFLSRGTAVVYAGLVVFLFGVAFMIRHASGSDLLSVELVVFGVMLSALAMLAFGWFLVRRRRTYALILQGGAVAVLYTCLFVAGEVYSLFPIFFVFCAMVSLTGLACLLAVAQNARQTALIGMAGGFLAPLLSPAANADLVFLWGYYLVLSGSILAMTCFRSWRELNAMGFFLTVAVAMLWGYHDYMPSLFWQVEPFLIVFFLFYSVITIVYILKNPDFENDRTIQTLVIGVPVCFVTFQSIISVHVDHVMPVTCMAMSVWYIAVAHWLWRTYKEEQKLLVSVFLVSALVYGNFAAFMAIGTQLLVIFFSAEASLLIWMGTRKKMKLPYGFGIVVHALAGLFLYIAFTEYGSNYRPAATGISAVFVSVSSLYSALRIYRAMPFHEGENFLHWILTLWGVLPWFAVGVLGPLDHVSANWRSSAMLLAFSANMIGLYMISRKFSWPAPGILARAFGPCLAIFAIEILIRFPSYMVTPYIRPIFYFGLPGWMVALSIFYVILARRENEMGQFMRSVWHRIGLWVTSVLICLHTYAITMELVPLRSDWILANTAAALGLLTAMPVFLGNRIRWPFGENPADYMGTGLFPLIMASWGWALWACLLPGNPRPMEYVPLANPLEISQAICLIAVYAWMRRAVSSDDKVINLPQVLRENLPAAFFGTVILCLTALVCRIVHHYTDVRFSMDSLFMSVTLQTSLSIFWSLVAVAVMIHASLSCNRRTWKMGSLLLFLVAGKLFLVDMFLSAAIARSLSFLWVGAVMVAAGYFGPMLPERAPSAQREKEAFA